MTHFSHDVSTASNLVVYGHLLPTISHRPDQVVRTNRTDTSHDWSDRLQHPNHVRSELRNENSAQAMLDCTGWIVRDRMGKWWISNRMEYQVTCCSTSLLQWVPIWNTQTHDVEVIRCVYQTKCIYFETYFFSVVTGRCGRFSGTPPVWIVGAILANKMETFIESVV